MRAFLFFCALVVTLGAPLRVEVDSPLRARVPGLPKGIAKLFASHVGTTLSKLPVAPAATCACEVSFLFAIFLCCVMVSYLFPIFLLCLCVMVCSSLVL